MYDFVIVGGGIAGLNMARLLVDKNITNICLLEKTDRLGGLIDTKHLYLKTCKNKKITKKNKTCKLVNNKIKYEAGAAVVYNYQKNMMKLINMFNIEVHSMPADNKTIINRHYKDFWDGKPRKRPLSKESVNKFFKLILKLFKFMDHKGPAYCRKFTLEQIALEILTFEEIRFIEFCYGYAAEFRIANSCVAKKNIENELFNSNEILVFKKGYSSIIENLYNCIKNKITLKKNIFVNNFIDKNNYIDLVTNKGIIKCKKVIFAIPQQALLNMCGSFTESELKLFKSVNGFSLNRIFAQYDVEKYKWMKNLNFSTVDNPIRQIIPLKKSLGLFQISYSDWYFADYWGSLSNYDAKSILKKLLSETFYYEKIGDPLKFLRYYWKDACHFWSPNHNEKKLYKRIQILRKKVFIIGESFSLNQGWAEGALQTSIDLAKNHSLYD